MKTRIVLTGILKDNHLLLAVKRNENDEIISNLVLELEEKC